MVIDWRQNPPIFWILERKDQQDCPTIIFETKDRSEAHKFLCQIQQDNPSGLYRLESRTER